MKFKKITISGKICTGKTTLFENLQKKLNWPNFRTGQLFRNYVKEHNLNLDQVQEQNEVLTKKIDNQVKDLLHKTGNLIVDGWMSGISANQQKDVFKVLLVCKDELRYKRFAKREGLDIVEAAKKVEERQNNWFSKIEKIHKINPKEFTKESNYNLVIDTSYITPQAVFKKVLANVIPA